MKMDSEVEFTKSIFEREINGKSRKFWVQLLPDDQKEKAISYFSRYFMRDEPLSKSLKVLEDKASTEFAIEIWRNVMNQNNCLACFVDLENGQKELVAVNLCFQASTNEKIVEENENTPIKIKQLIDTMEYMQELKSISEELGVTKYLGALGLVTIPEYRGMNIGLEVLKARKQLCEQLRLNASVTLFTSPASQRLAEKAGFKDLVSMTFGEIEKNRPSLKFPDINKYSKCLRNMYIMF